MIKGDKTKINRWFLEKERDFVDRMNAEEGPVGQFEDRVFRKKLGVLEYQYVQQFLEQRIWIRQRAIEEQLTGQDAGEAIMDQLERQFPEIVVKERSAESRRYVRQMADRLRRSEWTRAWTKFGWTMHEHFTAIRTNVFGLTKDSRLAADLLGEIDYGGGHDPPWK
jgi:hypothetical protein